jgi:hypothetical protein
MNSPPIQLVFQDIPLAKDLRRARHAANTAAINFAWPSWAAHELDRTDHRHR